MRNFRHILILLIILIAVLPSQAQVRDGKIHYGETYDGRIDNEEQFVVIGLTGSAGDVVNLTVVAPLSATLDPIVYILYGDLIIGYNDDAEDASVGAFNSQLKDFVLPHDGTYDVYIGGYSGTGDFTLSADLVGSLSEIDAFPIAYGETVTGTVDGTNSFYFYQFSGEAGDEVSIAMPADDATLLDTLFILYDADLFPLAVIDDNNADEGDYNAIYDNYTLPYSGTFYIVATRLEGAGSFSLSLSSGNVVATTPDTTPVSTSSALTYGESIKGFIDNTTTEINYTFSGTAGDVVTITMVADEGTNLDSVLKLLDPSGTLVAENDDAADLSLGRFNSQIIDFELPTSGEYTIVATRFNGAGNFTLSLDGQ
jgi:hypothetical protein